MYVQYYGVGVCFCNEIYCIKVLTSSKSYSFVCYFSIDLAYSYYIRVYIIMLYSYEKSEGEYKVCFRFLKCVLVNDLSGTFLYKEMIVIPYLRNNY